MDTLTDRQRRAEQIANAQIPGFAPETTSVPDVDSKPDLVAARDVFDVSGAPTEPPTDGEIARITHDVVEQLKTVYDPEIPTDIYELGLIYKVELDDDRTLLVDMTLTAPGCPVAGEMPIWVQDACAKVDGVRRVEVSMVFDPPWTPDRMSEEARLELNML
ncbi:MAG: SUF system Fe-S cluster assembly protein [Litorimonas sp.]